MATRNLTRKYVDIRNAQRANRVTGFHENNVRVNGEDQGSLLETRTREFNAAKNSLPPLWVEKIEVVEEDINKIQNKMRELSTLHTKRLMVNFESDEKQQEQAIERCTTDITTIFRHAEDILKKFGSQAKDPKLSQAERTVRQNSLRSMAKKLQGLSSSFRTSQKDYMSRVKDQKSGGSSGGAFDFLSPKKVSTVDVDSGFSHSQLQILEDTEELVETRDQEINKIAKSIEELAQIFKELAVLVIDQGTILDRIDYNMEQVVENTQEGMVHLAKAEQYQKNARATKCIVLLVLLIIIMIAVLVVKHQPKHN